ncbi:MAG: sigma 54-interacting transcriptional regulator [Peptostreptococcaceae bacterium]|jgi:transcriptional regulator with PAS, ATPase and Fis domain|nr:sigma 54-interacting transcriptional regulator [Peptostreptococcaceae bacterium]
MENLLLKIQESAIRYANVISNVIGIDVEIVDNNFNRVAGTGIYKDEINKNIIKEGFIYNHVMKLNKNIIIENPKENELCKSCKQKKNCKEEILIATPIEMDKNIIGVIGLVCSNENQKLLIKDKIKEHLNFIKEISELLTSKIKEFMELEEHKKRVLMFNEIIENMDKGVIVVDKNKNLIHINQKAKKELSLKDLNIDLKIDIKESKDKFMDKEIFTLNIKNKKIELIGKLIEVNSLNIDYDMIVIFNKINTLKEDAYNITTGHNYITTKEIIGESKSITIMKDRIRKIAKSTSTVFINGESGTGKELIARAIHAESDRKNEPFIAINCAAIPDALLESELFGYVKGAFSGANDKGRIGKFELANKGVIFLDEIGDMPLHLQVKILRVLQDKRLIKIGSNKLIKLDIRVIAATNKDLKKLIKENKFREDLYYRLNVIPIKVPPLRQRDGDIKLLTDYLINRYNKSFDKNVLDLDKDVLDALKNYDWPGNIRELENVIEYMMNLSENGRITKDMVPINILETKKKNNDFILDDEIEPLKYLEKKHILKALDIYGYDTNGKKIAAKKLGIGVATLYRKLEQFSTKEMLNC